MRVPTAGPTAGLVMMAALLLMTPACGGPTPSPAADNAPSPPTATVAAPSAEPVLLEVVDAAGTALSGDPTAGARVYRALCQSCHALTPGLNGTGPSLHGVVGRQAGIVEGFNYSAANRDSGVTWTQQQLFTYLERPQAVMPGTTMVFGGISQPQRRADLIAYLSQQTE